MQVFILRVGKLLPPLSLLMILMQARSNWNTGIQAILPEALGKVAVWCILKILPPLKKPPWSQQYSLICVCVCKWIISEDPSGFYLWVSEVHCSPQGTIAWHQGARRARVARSPLVSFWGRRLTKAVRSNPVHFPKATEAPADSWVMCRSGK